MRRPTIKPTPDECNDEDLLLFVHRVLSPRATRRMERHLKHCPACRSRYHVFLKTTGVLATAIRGNELPRWSLPAPFAASQLTRILVPFAIVSVIVTAGLVTLNEPVRSFFAQMTSPVYCPPATAPVEFHRTGKYPSPKSSPTGPTGNGFVWKTRLAPPDKEARK